MLKNCLWSDLLKGDIKIYVLQPEPTSCSSDLITDSDQSNTKIRSHAPGVTDWIYCLEPPGSPWLAAVGFLGLQSSKSSQLLHGRDFFILFHHFSKTDYIILTVFHTFL